MDLDKALDIRLEQRKKYLENPDFERLSNILTDEEDYRERRDNFLFIYLLYGYEYELGMFPNKSIMEKIFLEKCERSEINWSGAYNYYQARIKSVNNDEWFNPYDDEIQDVIYVLEKHKDKIIKPYVTF